MLSLIFIILMFVVFGKILWFAIKAAWGMSKIVCSVVLLPLLLLGMLIIGLVELALPILLIIGVVSLFVLHD